MAEHTHTHTHADGHTHTHEHNGDHGHSHTPLSRSLAEIQGVVMVSPVVDAEDSDTGGVVTPSADAG